MEDQKTLPEPLITISPERLSGAPEFTLTRVPLKNLFDYLTEGSPLDEFLQHFPGVRHAIAIRISGTIEQPCNPIPRLPVDG